MGLAWISEKFHRSFSLRLPNLLWTEQFSVRTSSITSKELRGAIGADVWSSEISIGTACLGRDSANRRRTLAPGLFLVHRSTYILDRLFDYCDWNEVFALLLTCRQRKKSLQWKKPCHLNVVVWMNVPISCVLMKSSWKKQGVNWILSGKPRTDQISSNAYAVRCYRCVIKTNQFLRGRDFYGCEHEHSKERKAGVLTQGLQASTLNTVSWKVPVMSQTVEINQ